MSTPSFRISSLATVAARFGLDWLSLTMISTGYVVPPTAIPFASACRKPPKTNPSASAKAASGPVCGAT